VKGRSRRRTSLSLRRLEPTAAFIYEYDFADSWEHEITVHRVERMSKGLKFAVCLDGANACPREDVGGSWGYEHLLAVLADPSHEDDLVVEPRVRDGDLTTSAP
jgi:hypothetical protein